MKFASEDCLQLQRKCGADHRRFELWLLVFSGLLVGRGLDTPEAPRAAAVYSWKGSQPSQYHPVHKEDMTLVGVGCFRKVACLCQANPDSVVALQSPQSSRFQHPGCQSAHAVAMNSVPPALTHHPDDEEGPKSPDHKQQKKDAADGESPGSQEAQRFRSINEERSMQTEHRQRHEK